MHHRNGHVLRSLGCWFSGSLAAMVCWASAAATHGGPPAAQGDWEASFAARLSDSASAPAMPRLAWLLATHADPRVRNGGLSLELAGRCVGDDAAALDLRAAALAETGDFTAAIAAAQQAARRARNTQQRDAIHDRLALYRQGIAHRTDAWPDFQPSPDRPIKEQALAYACRQVALEHRATNLSAAFDLLQHAVALDPAHAAAHVELAELLQQHGEPLLAIVHYRRALQLAPSPALWNQLGRACQEAGFLQSAAEAYRQVLATDPGQLVAANNLAWILATAADEALRDGREALRLVANVSSDDPDERLLLADTRAAALAELGQFEQAVQELRRAIDMARRHAAPQRVAPLRSRLLCYEARRPFRDEPQAVTPPEDASQGHRAMGKALVRQGRPAEALRHYLAAAAHSQFNDPGILNDLAALLFYEKRYAEAAAALARTLTLDPASVRAMLNLAWLQAACPDPRLIDAEQAVLLAETALDHVPDDLTAQDTLAVAYAAAGRFDDAVLVADHVVRWARQTGRTTLADAVGRRLEHYRHAEPYRDAAGQPPPSADEAAYARADAALAALALEQGRPAAARRKLQQALRTFPDDPALWHQLGQAQAALGDVGQATAAYRRAIELAPDWLQPRNNLAWLLATQVQPSAAEIQTALELIEPLQVGEDPLVLDTCAVVLAAAGRWEQAEEVLQRAEMALGDDHHHPVAAELRGRRRQFAGRQRHVETNDTVVFAATWRPLHLRLGVRAAGAGRLDEAARHLRGALRHEEDPDTLNTLGEVYRRLGNFEAAKECFGRAIGHRSDAAANNLAWLLATNPEAATQQELELAVQVAQRLCEKADPPDAAALDTLACAYAAVGRFDDAVAVAVRAWNLARHTPNPALLRQVERHLAAFRRGQPWRETADGDQSP